MYSKEQKYLIGVMKEDPYAIVTDEDMFFKFARNFWKIVSKVGDERAVIVPFEPFPSQIDFFKEYCAQRKERKPIRQVIHKSRQVGFSTMCGIVCCTELLLFSNLSALIATEKLEGSAKNIFRIYTGLFARLPWNEGKQLYSSRGKRNGVFKDYQNNKGFTTHNDSHLILQSQAEIVGFTFDVVHISEFSRFDNGDEFLSSLSPATHLAPDNIVFVESTARKTSNAFQRLVKNAEHGKSGWRLNFVPWFEDPRYTHEIPENERDTFINSLGSNVNEYGDEKSIKSLFDLTYEQMYWRRLKLTTDFEHNLAKFRREYPSTIDEAFISQNKSPFHMESLHALLKMCKAPKLKGRMTISETERLGRFDGTGTPIFKKDNNGAVEIWEGPKESCEYVAASDHAEGESEGSDYNVLLIACRSPFKIVAKVRGYEATKLGVEDFSKQAYLLMKRYNNAEVLPENNLMGKEVIRNWQRWEYPNIMYHQQVFGGSGERKWGWINNKATKFAGMEMMQDVLKLDFSAGKARFTHEWSPVIPDEITIKELINIEWKGAEKWGAANKGKDRPDGSSEEGYHDDCVIALMGLIWAQRSLPAPKTRDRLLLEKYGTDHIKTENISEWERDRYEESEGLNTPPANEWSWIEQATGI